MTERPLHHYWKLFIGFSLCFGFALYNVYGAIAYGEIIGSRLGNGRISFGTRPYWFSILLVVYIVMTLILGAALVKIIQFVLGRMR